MRDNPTSNRGVRQARMFLLLVLVALLLFAPEAANAVSISSVAMDAVSNIVARIFYLIYQIANLGLTGLVNLLGWAINFKVSTDVPVVSSTWRIVRDFSNMFFIVIMIVMAFAMIFKVRWLEGYDPGHLMVRFIVAALLINFSLVLCGLIITGTQSLNAIFITAIGDFGDRLGQGLNPSFLLGGTPQKDPTQLSLMLFFSTILLLIVDFSLIVANVFALIRVPFLWLLMILSPLALLGSILPNTKAMYQEWWKKFIGWNFFLPIFLAVLYLGLTFLSQQQQVMDSIAIGAAKADIFTDPGSHLSVPIQILFFYTLVALTLIGGTNAAIKGSLVAGVGAVSGAQWAKDWALRNTGAGAFGKAAQDRWKQIQESGYKIPGTKFNIIGGPPRLTDFAGRAFGVKGFEQQTLIAKKVGTEKKALEDEQRTIAELREIMQKDKGYRGLAAGELLLKEKKLRVNEVEDLRTRYGELKSTVAQKGFQERAQTQLDDMAENDRFAKKDDFDKAFEMLPEDGKEGFLRKAKKGSVNPVWIAQKQKKLNQQTLDKGVDRDGNPLTPEKRDDLGKSQEDLVREALQKFAPKDLLKLSTASLKSFKDEPYRSILEDWLTKDKIESIMKNEEVNDEKIRAFESALISKQGKEWANEIIRIENSLPQIRSRRDALQRDLDIAQQQQDQQRLKRLTDQMRGVNDLLGLKEKEIEELRTKQRDSLGRIQQRVGSAVGQPSSYS